jgi:RNA polymerase sigma-70 factor, ECF subfamily
VNRDRETGLIEECRRGNRQALGALIKEYQRPVFNAVYRMLGNPDGAADVTQTAFLKALENIRNYDPNFKFFSWVYRIAINEAIDHIERARRFAPLPDSPLVASDDAAGGAARVQANDRLQVALMSLSEDFRAVIVLHYFTGLSYDEIGSILDVPGKTVKSRLFTARRRLRERLEAEGVFSS